MIERAKRIWKYLFGDFPFKRDFEAIFNYENYWDSIGKRPFLPQRSESVADAICPGSSVLDVGCGDGTLLRYLRQEKNVEGLGIEVSQKAIEIARAEGVEVIEADITENGFNLTQSFDYIVISDVLEHIPNPEEVLQKLKGRFNNHLLVTIPNSGFIADRLRLLFGRFPKQWFVHPSEHLRYWTVSDFTYWCKELGFEAESHSGMRVHSYEFLPKLLWKHFPRLFSRTILYLIKDRPVHQGRSQVADRLDTKSAI